MYRTIVGTEQVSEGKGLKSSGNYGHGKAGSRLKLNKDQ